MTANLIGVPIPFNPESPILSAWLYIAWLAYPAEGEAQARQDLHEAFAAYVHKAQGKHAPEPLRRFKKSKAESVVRRGLMRAERRAFGAWVWLKHLDSRLSINAACGLATDPAGRVDYDAATAPDNFEPIWPVTKSKTAPPDGPAPPKYSHISDDYEQKTPDKNARRAFYEARPVIPMWLALPIFPKAAREAICPGLEGLDLPPRTMRKLAFSEDWIWKTCRDANRIVDVWRDHRSFATATLIIPVARSSIP